MLDRTGMPYALDTLGTADYGGGLTKISAHSRFDAQCERQGFGCFGPEPVPDNATYESRRLGSVTASGAIVEGFRFTL